MKQFARLIVKHWYWIPVWVLVVLIVGFVAVRLQSHFPLGSEQFIYPLRALSDVWWHVAAQVVGFVVRACIMMTPLVALIWGSWFVLTDFYPYNTLLDHAAAGIRVYVVFFMVALVGMFFVSPTPSEPQRLDSVITATRQYVLEVRTIYSLDIVYLYECDLYGILCQSTFKQTTWDADTHNLRLRMDANSIHVLAKDTVWYQQRYVDAG